MRDEPPAKKAAHPRKEHAQRGATTPPRAMKWRQVEALRTPFSTYSVTGMLGEGGSGVVLRARDGSGVDCAAKILRPGQSERSRSRFQNELSFGLRNDHPNVIRILDYGEVALEDGLAPFFVMPYFEGTLRTSMAARLSPEVALGIFSRILDGVECAHLKGIWHRDLKPENVLIGSDPERVVVADFGIAHFSEAELAAAVETRQQERLGNFRYAAPEQRVPGGAVDHRADLFSLGLILNEMFTGETPVGTNFRKIAEVDTARSSLDELVGGLLQQDPAKRPPDIAFVKRELRRLLDIAAAEQALNAKRTQVVPKREVGLTAPISIAGLDWEPERLLLRLDRAPEREWVSVFRAGAYSHGEVGGVGPQQAEVDGSLVAVPAREIDAQLVLNTCKVWISATNEAVAERAAERTALEARESQQRHEKSIQEAEQRLRVDSKLQL